jgi:acyl-CoA thioesterase
VTGPSLFEKSVTVTPAGEGRYGAHVEEAWNGPVSPNGGVLTATMVRAAQAELGPAAPPPRTVAAHFLEAPRPGAVELEVEQLRGGRRVAATQVRMRQDEKLVAHATIVHSAARADLLELRRRSPEVPAAARDAALPVDATPGTPRIFQQLDVQLSEGGTPFGSRGEAKVGGWMWIRGDQGPIDAARACALSDLFWPAIFGLLEGFCGVPTLQLTVHLRDSAGDANWPVFSRFCTRHVAEGHLEERGEIWSADGRLLAESVQLALLVPLPR